MLTAGCWLDAVAEVAGIEPKVVVIADPEPDRADRAGADAHFEVIRRYEAPARISGCAVDTHELELAIAQRAGVEKHAAIV